MYLHLKQWLQQIMSLCVRIINAWVFYTVWFILTQSKCNVTTMLLGGQMTDFQRMNIYLSCPVYRTALVSNCQSFANLASHIGLRRWRLWTNHSTWGTSPANACSVYVCWPCVGIRWAMVLISDTKQAMSEGKSGPAKTGLTRPVATTPIYKYFSNSSSRHLHHYFNFTIV